MQPLLSTDWFLACDWLALDSLRVVPTKPFTDIEGLPVLVDEQGAEVTKEYRHGVRCAEFVSHVAQVLTNNLICELKNRSMLIYCWKLQMTKLVLKTCEFMQST
jgi:hypothetical protein